MNKTFNMSKRKKQFKFHDDKNDITVKDLSSLADYAGEFWREGDAIQPDVERSLLRQVAQGSETVDAILRHMTDDLANAGYRFIPRPGVENPSQGQLKKLKEFFAHPNPEDTGDEWMESFIWDYLLYCDAYWEKVGDRDDKTEEKENYYGGDLKAVYHIDSSTMYPLANNETGQMPTDPRAMCYEQKVGWKKTRFDARKIIRASRFKRGRKFGQSPLVSLLNIIAGQINLTGYIGNLYNGNIPKTLINAGDVDDEDMERLIALLQEQMNKAQNPYGLVAINVPEGFQLSKLMDSANQGKFLETLEYYRSEICSVFGVPPTKMGWAVAGKLGSQEGMDDTYYDIIERIHAKLERIIFNGVITELECTDWTIKYNRIRPKQIKVESEARAKTARAIQVGRQEGLITVNEARAWYELESIDEDWADDPQFPSPVIAAKTGGFGEEGPAEEDVEKFVEDAMDEYLSIEEQKKTTNLNQQPNP